MDDIEPYTRDPCLNAVQRRCLAVIQGGRANDELRQAAVAMLRSGGLPKRAAKASGWKAQPGRVPPTEHAAAVPLSNVGAQARGKNEGLIHGAGWICGSCTLQNPRNEHECKACCALRPAEVGSSWTCSVCTLSNPDSVSRCAACNLSRTKAARGATTAGKRPMLPDFDEEDEAAFAVGPRTRT